MKEKLNLYIERIRDDTETLSETLKPTFMDVEEKDVLFQDPIELKGEAYVTDDYLIIRMSIHTKARLVCSFCNNSFTFDIDLPNFLHEEPLENISGATFDLLPLVRETILLALPMYPQCGLTSCNHRDEIEPYLKKQSASNNPFMDLQ
jgi:uncharacterized metal-binding protein YceD (DUF177 family)